MSNTAKQTDQISGAHIVVRTLEQQGVKWVFGVPGAKIDKVFNTLVDSSIQTVVCRHEQNAAFIAGGIGRMTGKAGVAIATSGPGVSNRTRDCEYRGRSCRRSWWGRTACRQTQEDSSVYGLGEPPQGGDEV